MLRPWPLKDRHILIPRTWEYITLQNKRDFADVIKLRGLRWGDYLGPSGGSTLIIKVLIRERQEDQSRRRRCNCRKERSERVEDTPLMALKIEEGP